MKEKIIIDCDPGVDDALTIAIALLNPKIEVLGITTVSGNKDLETTTINALKILEYFKRSDVPVYKGLSKPLQRDLFIPPDDTSHGKDGLGDCGLGFPNVFPKENAIEFIKDQIRRNPKEITLFGIGPLTNIATVLKEIDSTLIKQIYIMNGAFQVKGNQTEFSEYNSFIDPEAADIVYNKNVPIKAVGLDATNLIGMSREEYERIGSLYKSPLAEFFARVYKKAFYREEKELYVVFWDILTIFWFLYPNIFSEKRGSVRVETQGEKSGMTIFHEGKGNIEIATGIDQSKFFDIFTNLLKNNI